MARRHEEDEFVRSEKDGIEAALGWLEGDDPEIDRAKQDFLRQLPGGEPPHFHENARVIALERLDQRENRVHGALVRTDDHATLLDVPKFGNGARGLFCQTQEPVGVLEKQVACVGERAVAGGAVDEPLTGRLLEPSYGLTDCRLGSPQLLRGFREAPLAGNGDKYPKILEGHSGIVGPTTDQVNKLIDY